MRLTTAGLLAGLSLACSAAQPITGVKVCDADFKVVKQLAPTELPEFERAWSAKTTVDSSLNNVGGRHFKLDIEKGSDAGDRWLYQTTGYVQVLAVKGKEPVYKLQNPQAFNKIIGATE
jgi:hypothetical protein